MKTTDSLKDLNKYFNITDIVLACGVFDGVHKGHQQVIAELQKMAALEAAEPVVLTFEPHPQAVLRFDMGPPRLTTTVQKVELLHQYGAKATVILRFSEQLADLSADDFLYTHLLTPNVKLHAICIGSDWRFGKRAEGDADYLRRKGGEHGFAVKTVPPFTLAGQTVSSTRIRKSITEGGLKQAERMLGRPYAIRGEVTKGKQLGASKLQCPTANVAVREQLLPPSGVYAGGGRILDGSASMSHSTLYPGIIYTGSAPSFNNISEVKGHSEKNLEFHFFNLNQDLYGHHIEVEFYDFIRNEKTFSNPSALSHQIEKDIKAAQTLVCNRKQSCS